MIHSNRSSKLRIPEDGFLVWKMTKDSALPIIDTHCHIDVEAFDEDREAVLAGARRQGVCAIVVPAIDRTNWDAVRTLCVQHPDFLFPALGLHPVYIDLHRDQHLLDLADLVTHYTPLAIGEIGLDFLVKALPRERQLTLFEAQLEIAEQYKLPVIMHVRKAYDEVLGLLEKHHVTGGISHAFNGSIQHAFKLIDQGFKLGFGGTMTYENARRIHQLARRVPLDAIVLETDAPDMTVAPFRGGRNSPEYLPYCLRALADLRALSVEEVADVTTRNARSVLRIW